MRCWGGGHKWTRNQGTQVYPPSKCACRLWEGRGPSTSASSPKLVLWVLRLTPDSQRCHWGCYYNGFCNDRDGVSRVPGMVTRIMQGLCNVSPHPHQRTPELPTLTLWSVLRRGLVQPPSRRAGCSHAPVSSDSDGRPGLEPSGGCGAGMGRLVSPRSLEHTAPAPCRPLRPSWLTSVPFQALHEVHAVQ